MSHQSYCVYTLGLPSNPDVYIVIPPPVYTEKVTSDGLKTINPKVVNKVLPHIVSAIAKVVGIEVIDVFSIFGGR